MNGNQKKRLTLLIVGVIIAVLGLIFLPALLKDKAALYVSPDEIKEQILSKPNEAPQRVRLGGYVTEGSVKSKDGTVSFIVTDFQTEIPVMYRGTPPDLFREGQGVYVEGRYDKTSGVFIADVLFAKHDENYRPPVPGSEEE
jgi:cytochrome c-type biogenesis protein CcmE